MQHVFCGSIKITGTLSPARKREIENLIVGPFRGTSILDIREDDGNTEILFDNVESRLCLDDLEEIVRDYPVVSGRVRYGGDTEGEYLFREGKWSHHEPFFLSDLSIHDLRELTDQCPKALGAVLYGCYAGQTTDDVIEANRDKDVVSQISLEMMDDDENDSSKLIDLYRFANRWERGLLDYMLVCLCGWTMEHILQEAPEMDE